MAGYVEWNLKTIIGDHIGGCQNYGPFLGTREKKAPHYNGDPKRDHNFDNHPYIGFRD